MSLRLYNTLTRRKDVFAPIDASRVRMYVCGPTVYDEAHIGNARPVIVFDVLFRLLGYLAKRGEWDGGKGDTAVTYVRNLTDVDDKINARAAERGITIRALTEETARVYQADMAALGALPPTEEPRATDNIPQMIDIIARLIARGHAYAADGHVLFSVPSLPAYGRLSRRPLDEMIAGARVDVAPYKRADTDFVLWKPSPPDLPGWDSPWGRGRPGWHIECSAMAWRYLGERFDIHGGGIDLVFPHHENEIAQTCGAFGHDVMANVWMHNGFLQVEGEKMSKSLGNFFTVGDLLRGERFGGRRWPGVVLRYAMLTAHYRQPIDWTLERLQVAEKHLHALWARTRDVEAVPAVHPPIEAALLDDLNTPQAIAELSTLLGDANRDPTNIEKARVLRASCEMLGLRLEELDTRSTLAPERAEQIEVSINARLAARAAKNWAESDRIRDELVAMGVVLKDNKDGTTSWEVKP